MLYVDCLFLIRSSAFFLVLQKLFQFDHLSGITISEPYYADFYSAIVRSTDCNKKAQLLSRALDVDFECG